MKIGIDFGTSTSEAAFVNSEGKIVMIPNHLGEFITPSVVYIDENHVPVVGQEAKEKAVVEPENTFLEVKRLFGKETNLTARGKGYSAVDIAAMIIQYLTDCAKKFIGEEIDSAVITVPAYFTDSQRKDVMAAGKSAGLSIDRIINEPTSASLDYGINHMRECENILVYDLGGGTLDVTVLELFEGVVDVKSSCGNNELGGKDFDNAIIDYITGKIKKSSSVDIKSDLQAMMRIKIAAEQCKIALSTETEYLIELPFLYKKKDSPAGYSETFTREVFESIIKEKVYSTSQQIKTTLYDADLKPEDIDLTLLVGGSTRIPLVKKFLAETFGFESKTFIDPDLAVVRGAAIQAGVLSGALSENAIVLTDICPFSLSTEVAIDVDFGEKTTYCDFLIKRNTVLPVSVSKVYCTTHDNQTDVYITAYQGESREPDENYLLNCFELSGIPKGKANKERISIAFEYDLNGILKVSAEILSTGKMAEVVVNTTEMGQNLDLSKWKETPLAKQYRKLINKADRLIKIHGDIKADEISSASDELKKALILDWDMAVIEKLERDLIKAIEYFEENEVLKYTGTTI